jgi:7-cyano-7-deazaguanine synthase
MPSAVVLLSSGLDSTVNLFSALRKLPVVRAVTFNYGQRAAIREIEQSQKICKKLNLAHQVIELPWLKAVTSTALVNIENEVPVNNSVSIDDYSQSMKTAKAVWVPNRNGVFLNIAAAIAEGLGAEYVIPGFNKEEAVTFPDNSQAYLNALDNSFSFSTSTRVKTLCYTTDKNKTEIVALGREMGAPFDLMWPCYFGGDQLCGECESCKRFERAIRS